MVGFVASFSDCRARTFGHVSPHWVSVCFIGNLRGGLLELVHRRRELFHPKCSWTTLQLQLYTLNSPLNDESAPWVRGVNVSNSR